MLQPGDLNRRIRIERPTTGTDDYGQPLPAGWELVAACWANVRPTGGRERVASMQMDVRLTHTVAVHYQAKLMPPTTNAQWRIVYGERILQITYARDLNDARQWIVFECVEGAQHG